MERIVWKDEYSVGVAMFDEQHKGLVDLINSLARDSELEGKNQRKVLDSLDRYVKEHFRAEEALMRERQYPRLEEHRIEHKDFEDWLEGVKLSYRFTAAHDTFVSTVNTFLRNWMVNHILKTDMDYKSLLGE